MYTASFVGLYFVISEGFIWGKGDEKQRHTLLIFFFFFFILVMTYVQHKHTQTVPRFREECCMYYLLTGCKGRTNQVVLAETLTGVQDNIRCKVTGCKGRIKKYKLEIFHTARACEGCVENQGLLFHNMAREHS